MSSIRLPTLLTLLLHACSSCNADAVGMSNIMDLDFSAEDETSISLAGGLAAPTTKNTKRVKRTVCDGDSCSVTKDLLVDDVSYSFGDDAPDPAARELCEGLDALREFCTIEQHGTACKMLLKYCENAAADPKNDKFRTIRISNAAFQRHLAPHAPVAGCLKSMGFTLAYYLFGDYPSLLLVPSTLSMPQPQPPQPAVFAVAISAPASALAATSAIAAAAAKAPAASDAPSLVGAEGSFELRSVDVPRLQRAATVLRAERRFVRLRPKWPEPLRRCLPAACHRMRDAPPSMLQSLADELAAPHVPELLAHKDNVQRIENSLLSATPDVIEGLVAQLREIRSNVTQSAAGPAGTAAGPGRVREIRSMEEWYDLLMEDESRLIVADFGATWCGPCQAIKPLFAQLSEKYKDVTFVSLDADQLPVVMGDNMVDSYPTFKFFRYSAEADLPVVGADIAQVEQRLLALLAE